MPKKLDPKVVEAVMLIAGLKPLEPYKDSKTKWKCKCLKCKKIVFPIYSNVKNGHSGCAYCVGKLVDPEDALRVAKKAKFLPLEPFGGSSTPWKCRHLPCNRIIITTYNQLQQRGSGCKYCSNTYTDPTFAVELMLSMKLKPLEPYINAHAKWKCRCLKCKRIVFPAYHGIQQGNGGCAYCAGTKVEPKTAVKVMLKAKLKPLEPYKGGKNKWKCRCLKCKRTVTPLYSDIVQGHSGCKHCVKGVYVDPNDAVKIMIKAGLKPLEPYKAANLPWKCKCLACGNTVTPMWGSIQQGQGGCLHCADHGFNFAKPSYLYLLHHEGFNSFKVGISGNDARPNRVRVHTLRGWRLIRRFDFENGEKAYKSEQKILGILREVRNLPPHLNIKLMPNGWKETVDADSITLLQLEKIINKVIKGLQR